MAGGGRAHVYELTWPAPGGGGVLGACHGLDIPLLFGTFDADLGRCCSTAPGPRRRRRRCRPASAPPGPRSPRRATRAGPRTTPGRRLTQVFDAEPEVTAYPEEASRLLWQDHTFPALPLLG